ncbi:substrate-binding domain-containing protein [Streptomyces sp. R-74717]
MTFGARSVRPCEAHPPLQRKRSEVQAPAGVSAHAHGLSPRGSDGGSSAALRGPDDPGHDLIGGAPGVEPGEEHFAGYRKALEAAGLPVPGELVAWTGFTREGGRAGAATVLSAAERPDAVVCANDLIAIGALGTARAAGLRVPHDVAITGYDDIEAASLVSPRPHHGPQPGPGDRPFGRATAGRPARRGRSGNVQGDRPGPPPGTPRVGLSAPTA